MEGGDATVAAELSAVAATVAGHLPELSSEIWALLTQDIAELRGDQVIEKLLDASIEENVATLLHVFEHGLVPDEIRAPPAAVEYARRLAQRGVSTIALVRAYRVGHGRFLSRCVEQLASRTTDAALNAAVTLRLVDVSFRYIDRVSEELILVYQQERDRWLLTQTAVRAGRVRELLRGGPVDVATIESALGYRLRRHHLGVIAWVVGDVHGSEGLTRLDRLGARAARALSARSRYLFVPRDESLAWLWIPLGADTRVSEELLTTAFEDSDGMVRVAVGAPGYGLDGFRQTHIQAERTQDVALAAKPGARVTTFADVGAIALICADVDAARSWVWGTLADLAVDDESHARLRNTLQVFLRTGTYTATAEQLALHKNSVQYRIRKAEEALGARLDDRRADVELALRACQYLGQAVLRPVDSGPSRAG
jgi:DNA-binding PucR family transcriptional regulator